MAAMRVAVALVAAFAFAVAANAQTFPYARCNNNTAESVYSTPTVTVNKDGSFCWTIKYDPKQCKTDNYCCEAPVHKLQFDVNPDCKDGFSSDATITSKANGVVKVVAKINNPPNAADNQAVLTVPDIDLTLEEADGATVCIKPTRGKCMTFASLVNGKVWTTALWDDNHKCCPITKGSESCKTTITWSATAGLGFSFGSAEAKATATKAIADIISTASKATGVTILSESAVAFPGSATTATTTLEFADKAAAEKFAFYVTGTLTDAATKPVYGLDLNDATCGGKQLNPKIAFSGCATPEYTTFCTVPPPDSPFPFCKCNKSVDATPFSLSTVEVTSDTTAEIYIVAKPGMADAKFNCLNSADAEPLVLKKVELWLKESERFRLKGSYVNGKFVAPSWGGKDLPDTYKIKVDMTYAQVLGLKDGLKIVVEAKAGQGPMTDLVADPSGNLWVSLFDPSNKCCPTEYFG